MELEFKRSALKQLKYYKKKNPIAYRIIREKLEEIIKNPEDGDYKKVKKYPKYKRARKGNYRICFRVDNNCIYIGSLSKIFLMTHLFCLADAESKIYFSPHKHATHYA